MSTLRCSATARWKGGSGSFQVRDADSCWASPNMVSVSTSSAPASSSLSPSISKRARAAAYTSASSLGSTYSTPSSSVGRSSMTRTTSALFGSAESTVRAEELDDVGPGEAEQEDADVGGVVGQQVLAQLLGGHVEARGEVGERQAVGMGGQELEHGGEAADALGVLRDRRHHSPAI